MRSFRRDAVAGALLAASLASVPLSGGTPAAASTSSRRSRSTATEVCEPMVRDAIEAVTGRKLAAPQQGSWQGNTFSCVYDVGGGSLVLRVRVLHDRAATSTAYRALRKAATVDQVFNGFGQAAFQAKDATLVARKDRFLLTADPSLLPADLTKKDVAFAAVAAVLSCWTGGK